MVNIILAPWRKINFSGMLKNFAKDNGLIFTLIILKMFENVEKCIWNMYILKNVELKMFSDLRKYTLKTIWESVEQ